MFFLLLTVIAIILVYLQKYKYAFLIHIFVITKGFRFFMAPQLEAFGIAFQPTDLSILFILFAYNEFIFRNHLNALQKQFKQSIMFKLFMWFVLLIIIEAFIDYFFNMTSIADILKANRKWLTLAVLPLYHYLEEKDIKWIIKAIVLITLVQILIVPLQPVFNFEIPGSIRADGFGGIRYGLMPYFWFLSFWFIYCTPRLKIKQKMILLLIIVFVLLFAEARKNFLAIIVSIIFFHSLKLSMKNIVTSVVIIVLFSALVIQLGNSDRIKRFQTDLGNMFGTSLKTFVHNRGKGEFGTSALRYYLVLERYQYLKKYPRKLLFGYGFVHEKNLQQNPFSLMVAGIHTLDIGDISWAYLLVRYGILGIILMAFLVLINIRYFIKHIDNDPLFKVGLMYMITILVLSFGDNFLTSPVAFTVPYMITILANPVNFNKPVATQSKILL